MVQKSRTDQGSSEAASEEAAKTHVRSAPAKPRATVANAYDSFWHCLSGRRPVERWTRHEDVAPLRTLRMAFGLAEEPQPIDYGPMTRTGSVAAPARMRTGPSTDDGERSSDTAETMRNSPPARRR